VEEPKVLQTYADLSAEHLIEALAKLKLAEFRNLGTLFTPAEKGDSEVTAKWCRRGDLNPHDG
jgi:hypothetical protein